MNTKKIIINEIEFQLRTKIKQQRSDEIVVTSME